MRKLLVSMTMTALLGLTGCSDDGATTTGGNDDVADVLALLPGNAALGEDAFNASCASGSCHGVDGDSGPGTPLSEVVPMRTDAELATIIRFGVGSMVPQGNLLDAQEIADSIAYCRQEYGGQ